jgi:hypothetical protein
LQLEAQLTKLAELGLHLNPDLTIEDLLDCQDRADFETYPFTLLLFWFGSEVKRAPSGRQICNRVWSFDPECITGTGDYVNIIQKLCLLTGNLDYLTDIVDQIDLEEDDCWLEYSLGEKRQHLTIEVNDDWADMLALADVMADLQRDGYQFFALDRSEATILLYLDRETAEKLGDLCQEDLEPLVPVEY